MSILTDVCRTDWEDREDPERAVTTAHRLYEAVRDGDVDAVSAIDALEDAAEPLWDAKGGDPALVLEVALAIQRAFVRVERFGGLKDPKRLEARVRPMMLLARAQHRVSGQEREGFLTALTILTFLEDFVDGSDALRDVIPRPTSNPVAQATVAALGLYPAALRRARLPWTVREQYKNIGLRLVRAYVGAGGPRVIYPRTAALASQWLYLLVEDHRPDEQLLVHVLYALDLKSRPQHQRGQATSAERDAAYAKYCHDDAGYQRHREAALANLERFELLRHQEVVQRFGYFAA